MLIEDAFFEEKEILVKTIQQLKQMEFVVVLDEFGSGYSSLKSIIELPVDILKMDSVLFSDKETDRKSGIIVEEIIKLAKLLDLKIVADGVE